MPHFKYKLEDHVALLTMTSGENLFTFEFLDAFLAVLDEIENETKASVLVVTSADKKIWSNGINLTWLMEAVAKDPDAAFQFPMRIMKALRRILTYPMITIAAMNGHAFAGGAIMSCAFDFRFMRTERGFFCFPEVDINIPFMPGMDAVIRKAFPGTLLLEAQLTGRRYTAEELEANKVIVKACPVEELLERVMDFARAQNKGREILRTMKTVGFKSILQIMDTEDAKYLKEKNTFSGNK
jgi:enoyl-CoA hydratase/carnithine racemase